MWLETMFTSNEYSSGILYEHDDRCYNEVDEEERVAETAAHIIRQNIHGMVYDL